MPLNLQFVPSIGDVPIVCRSMRAGSPVRCRHSPCIANCESKQSRKPRRIRC